MTTCGPRLEVVGDDPTVRARYHPRALRRRMVVRDVTGEMSALDKPEP